MPHVPGHTPQAPETPEQRNRRLQRQFEKNRKTPAVPSLAAPSQSPSFGIGATGVGVTPGPTAGFGVPLAPPAVPALVSSPRLADAARGEYNPPTRGHPGGFGAPGPEIYQPRIQSQAPQGTVEGRIRGAIADAARYTAQAIQMFAETGNKRYLPGIVTPQIATAMGITEQQRIEMGYNPQWPYNQMVAAGVTGGGGVSTRVGRRVGRRVGGGGGSRGLGGGPDLINWRI